MNVGTITAHIGVDNTQLKTGSDDAKRQFQELERSATKSVSSIKTAFLGVASAFTAIKITQHIQETVMLAARYETLGVVQTIVGKNFMYTAAQMDNYQQALEKTGIAAIESRQSLSMMAQAQIDLASATKLGRIAQDAAVIGNINSSESFQRMIYGIQSAQVEVLRTIGLNVNFMDSYKKLADQLGKNVNTLTNAEKTQARVNAVMEAGVKISGTYEAAMGTAGKQILSLKRYIDNIKVSFGEMFQPALSAGVADFTNMLKIILNNMDAIKIAIELIGVAAVSSIAGMAVNSFNTLIKSLKTVQVLTATSIILDASGNFLKTTTAVSGMQLAMQRLAPLINGVKSAMTALFTTMGGLVTIILTAAGAWMTYIHNKSKALDDSMTGKGETTYWRLQREIGQLKELNRQYGLTKEAKQKEQVSSAIKDYDAMITAAQKKIKELQTPVMGVQIHQEEIQVIQQQIQAYENEKKLLPQVIALKEKEQAIADANRQKMLAAQNQGGADKETERRIKHIARLNKELRQQNEEYGKGEIELINIRAQRYLDEGRSRVLVEQWAMNEVEKVRKAAMMEELQIMTENSNAIIQDELARAERYAQLNDEILQMTGNYEEAAKARWKFEQTTPEFMALSDEEKAMRGRIAGVNEARGRIQDSRNAEYDVRYRTQQIQNSTPNAFGGIGFDQQDAQRQQELAYQQQQIEDELELLRAAGREKTQIYQDYIDQKIALDKQYQAENKAIERERIDAAVSATSSMLSNMSGMLDSHNRKQFALQKAMNIAVAIMNTYTGATKALSQGGMYGAVMAGMVIAQGMMQVAQIMSQKYQGRRFGGPVQAGQMVNVNEAGFEMFSVGGKDYLLNGAKDGQVTSSNGLGKGGLKLVIEQHGTPQHYEQAQSLSADEVRFIAQDEINKKTPKIMADQAANSNSLYMKSMRANTNTTRRRSG